MLTRGIVVFFPCRHGFVLGTARGLHSHGRASQARLTISRNSPDEVGDPFPFKAVKNNFSGQNESTPAAKTILWPGKKCFAGANRENVALKT